MNDIGYFGRHKLTLKESLRADKKQYEKDLKERQRKHLDNVRGNNQDWQPCMHDQCSDCHGTGVKSDGTVCVHMISCPCPKCNPFC